MVNRNKKLKYFTWRKQAGGGSIFKNWEFVWKAKLQIINLFSSFQQKKTLLNCTRVIGMDRGILSSSAFLLVKHKESTFIPQVFKEWELRGEHFLKGEHFYEKHLVKGEHFEESTFNEGSTLRRALLMRRAYGNNT